MSEQLILNVNLKDDATFENFFLQKGSENAVAVEVLQKQLLSQKNSFVYLWGGQGSGVSHLLQASCHNTLTQNLSAQYLSLSEFLDYSPEELFKNLDVVSLICLDNIQAISGNMYWEQQLFNLYNRIKDSSGSLLVGANCSARELPLNLPDLHSRLSSGSLFQLASLDDISKSKIIQFRALRRGMKITDDLAQFIIARSPREMNSLMNCLDILEKFSLQEKRKLSKPLIKSALGWE